MPKKERHDYDLIVIGGGPGGATLATLVAKQGHRVLLLERDHFPRHQIGESLLPATIHGICPLLGVADEIRSAGFMRKNGGTFRWGANQEPWTFAFSVSPRTAGPTSFAYQVERSKFDAILLNNARAKGVEVREGCRVTDVLSDDTRITGVRWSDETRATRTATASYVADASGNESRVSEKIGSRSYSRFFQNLALYGYFDNGKRLPQPNDGNILCVAFDRGWFWYIPLTEKLTSVGAVVSKDQLPVIQQGHGAAMQKFIAECPLIGEQLNGATRVTEGIYGKLRVRKDFSYCCDRFWAPGMMLIGDAACFVDPVFSSGVHLATYSALQAARSVNSCLRGILDETTAFNEFELRYRREYGIFYRFLVSFYDMHQDENSYFWTARKILGSDEAANQAFARLVGGIGASGEPLFGSTEKFSEAMQNISNSFRDAQRVPGRFDLALLDKGFMSDLSREGMHLEMRGAQRAMPEMPLWKAGLIPTPDGIHWARAGAG